VRWRAVTITVAVLVGTAGTPIEARAFDATKIDASFLTEVLAAPTADFDVIVRSVPSDSDKHADRATARRIEAAAKSVTKQGGSLKHALAIVGAVSARLKGVQVLKLTRDNDVDYVAKDQQLRAQFDPALDSANVSTILRGLQWVLANRNAYNIRVVNMSLGATPTGSYKSDFMATAAEVLNFAGVTVVVSAGNTGPLGGTVTTPATDPYVVTVGALDDNGTSLPFDDLMTVFSSRGRTVFDNLSKPDLVAPGRKMISLRSPGSELDTLFPDRQVVATGALSANYYRLSGTSMAAPVVTGVIALMVERNPALLPAQIKKRLKSSATALTFGTPFDRGAGLVNAYKAVSSVDPGREFAPDRVSD